MGAGGDVKENHFVGTLLVVADGQFDRVADVTEFAGLGLAKLHPAGDLPRVNIQTWNNSLRQHRAARK
jgi:hypothetical protein